MIVDSPKEMVENQIDFYDAATLKEYTSYMNILPEATSGWIENCVKCHVPMRTAMLDQSAVVKGIVGSEVGVAEGKQNWPRNYQQWLDGKLVVRPNNTFYVCPVCERLWTIVDGSFWANVKVNDQERFKMEVIQQEVSTMPTEQGPAPTPNSTKCPEHHVWREIKPYSDTEEQHVCPICKTADIFKIHEEEN